MSSIINSSNSNLGIHFLYMTLDFENYNSTMLLYDIKDSRFWTHSKWWLLNVGFVVESFQSKFSTGTALERSIRNLIRKDVQTLKADREVFWTDFTGRARNKNLDALQGKEYKITQICTLSDWTSRPSTTRVEQ